MFKFFWISKTERKGHWKACFNSLCKTIIFFFYLYYWFNLILLSLLFKLYKKKCWRNKRRRSQFFIKNFLWSAYCFLYVLFFSFVSTIDNKSQSNRFWWIQKNNFKRSTIAFKIPSKNGLCIWSMELMVRVIHLLILSN